MDKISKEIANLEKQIEQIKEETGNIKEAILITNKYNGRVCHIWANGGKVYTYIDVMVGEPKKGMIGLLKELAQNGFRQEQGNSGINCHNTGINWHIKKNNSRLTITALIEGTNCKLVQVDTETKPVYEVRCN